MEERKQRDKGSETYSRRVIDISAIQQTVSIMTLASFCSYFLDFSYIRRILKIIYPLTIHPMKYLYSFVLVLLIALLNNNAYADFFNEQIVGADPETGIIRDIYLNPVTLKDGKEMKRYNATAYFVTSIKNEAVIRFESGEIPLYRRYDIITHLDSFVYTMNQYFLYQKRYEQNRKDIYKETARDYLETAK